MRESQPRATFSFEPILYTANGSLYGLQLVYTGGETRGYAPPPGHRAIQVELMLEVLSEWQRIVPGLRLTIPASSPELDDAALAGRWLTAARRAAVEPGSIELGLDPLFRASEERAFRSNLGQLREAGAGIVQMGFGIGYASMALWTTISFTRIELHSTFLQSVNDNSAELVAMLANTNSAFGFMSTASGVGNPTQLKMVKDCGVELMRGPAVAPPLVGLGVNVWLNAYQNNRVVQP